MKKSFILMLFSVLLSSFGFLQAQTAVLTETSCNSLHVSLTGACGNAYSGGGRFINGDWYFSSYSLETYKVTLRKALPNFNSEIVQSVRYLQGGTAADWINLPQGETYFISVEAATCSPQRAFTVSGQLLGFRVFWGNPFFSNPIKLGSTQQSDLSVQFLDSNGSVFFGTNTNYFAPNEKVKINTSASQNYDRYALAIQEFYPDGVTPGRWRGYGNNGYGSWQTGQMPNVINLTDDLWGVSGTGWDFIPGYSYRLQVVLSKDACPSWTQSLPFFYICQAGFGCRAGGEKKADNKISLSPNPASNKFRLDGINFTETKNCNVSISDISGKEIQRFNDVTTNEFAVNGLTNGVYIVNITADNRRLFSSKLVVNH